VAKLVLILVSFFRSFFFRLFSVWWRWWRFAPYDRYFFIRPNAYPAKILEKGCPTWPDNRGCTVLLSYGYCWLALLGSSQSSSSVTKAEYVCYVKIDHTMAHQIYATVFPSFKRFSDLRDYLQSDNEKVSAIP